jgi:hypothetical protein
MAIAALAPLMQEQDSNLRPAKVMLERPAGPVPLGFPLQWRPSN